MLETPGEITVAQHGRLVLLVSQVADRWAWRIVDGGTGVVRARGSCGRRDSAVVNGRISMRRYGWRWWRPRPEQLNLPFANSSHNVYYVKYHIPRDAGHPADRAARFRQDF